MLVLVVAVEKGLGIDVPGVDVGSDWLTQILAALGLGTPARWDQRGEQVTGRIALVLIGAAAVAASAILAAGRKAGAAA